MRHSFQVTMSVGLERFDCTGCSVSSVPGSGTTERWLAIHKSLTSRKLHYWQLKSANHQQQQRGERNTIEEHPTLHQQKKLHFCSQIKLFMQWELGIEEIIL